MTTPSEGLSTTDVSEAELAEQGGEPIPEQPSGEDDQDD